LAVEVARGSFDQAVRAIETTTGGQVPKRQAEELAAKVSQDFEAFYQHRASRGPEEKLPLPIQAICNSFISMVPTGSLSATRLCRILPPAKDNRFRGLVLTC
jgi:hypothetical protein